MVAVLPIAETEQILSTPPKVEPSFPDQTPSASGSADSGDHHPRSRRFTVAEYQRMTELGIFPIGERLELINGFVTTMVAKGFAHSSATHRITKLFERTVGDRFCIRGQDPIQLDDHSAPEPDVSVVQLDPLDYSTHHPTSDEVLLVIEVADSSLKYDLEVKAPLYAKSRITEYWVLDVVDRKLHVFREPNESGYQLELVLRELMTVVPIAFADWTIAVADLLPPLAQTNEPK
jgi:Uma2 family endonuclease